MVWKSRGGNGVQAGYGEAQLFRYSLVRRFYIKFKTMSLSKIRGSRLPSVELFLTTLVEKASETLDFDKGLSWRRWLDVSHMSDSEFVLLINHLS